MYYKNCLADRMCCRIKGCQNLISTSLLLTLCLLNLNGCSREKGDPRGERVSVNGIVYSNGEPLPSARILFISDTPGGKVKSAGIVRLGIYQIPETGGPVIGKARVEIYPTLPEMEEFAARQKNKGKRSKSPYEIKIPAAYNKRSELTAMVTNDGENSFDFQLKTY